MNKYIIKAAKPEKGDPFGFKKTEAHLYFFACGLKDLRNTLRCITPCGFHVRTSRWFSNYLKSGKTEIVNPLSRNTMYEIQQVKDYVKVEQELDWNNNGFKHRLKIVSSFNWKDDSNL